MNSLLTLSSSVLIDGYVSDIIHRQPATVKELLAKAIESKNSLVFKAVVENTGFKSTTYYSSNLMFLAIKENCSEILDIILKNSLNSPNDCDSYGRAALTCAILNNSSDCAFTLIEHGADVNHGCKGLPPLVAAAKHNNTQVVRKLIEKKANVNVFDAEGRSALFYAAKSAIGVPMLLEAGSSPDTVEKSSGSTPLMVACVEGFDRIVELMAVKSKNPNIIDNFGHSALTYVSNQGHLSSIKKLLSIGASLSVYDNNGFSIVSQAVLHKQRRSLITLLLEAPEYPKTLTTESSPLYIAVKSGDVRSAIALLYAGVDRHLFSSFVEYFALFPNEVTSYQQEGLFEFWKMLLPFAVNKPLPLQVFCRNAIRKQLGRNLLEKIENLELPPCIIDFIGMAPLNLLLKSDVNFEIFLQFFI